MVMVQSPAVTSRGVQKAAGLWAGLASPGKWLHCSSLPLPISRCARGPPSPPSPSEAAGPPPVLQEALEVEALAAPRVGARGLSAVSSQ